MSYSSVALRNIEIQIRRDFPYGRYRKIFKTQTPEGRANFLRWIVRATRWTFTRTNGDGQVTPRRYSIDQIEELGRHLKVSWTRQEIIDWHYNEMDGFVWLYRTRGADLIQLARRK